MRTLAWTAVLLLAGLGALLGRATVGGVPARSTRLCMLAIPEPLLYCTHLTTANVFALLATRPFIVTADRRRALRPAGASEAPEGSVEARLLDVPAFVISEGEARWHRTKAVRACRG